MKLGVGPIDAGKHPVEHERMKMYVEIQRGAEALNDDDGAAARALDAGVAGPIGEHAEHRPRQDGGYLAFGMGAVAALLAGACVAPVVIQVILFSSDLYAGGSTAALALPFMLGVGMALPWPIAGAGLSALPKPGAWMVRVKQAFGIFILGMAAYYGWIAYGLFANRWVDPAEVRASVEAKLEEGWYADLDEGLAVAEREGKLVLIDLWATWCKNCVVMDETTLVDPAVEARLADYVKIKHQAEFPDDPPDNLLMKRIGAIGLPAYAIFRPKGAVGSEDER